MGFAGTRTGQGDMYLVGVMGTLKGFLLEIAFCLHV